MFGSKPQEKNPEPANSEPVKKAEEPVKSSLFGGLPSKNGVKFGESGFSGNKPETSPGASLFSNLSKASKPPELPTIDEEKTDLKEQKKSLFEQKTQIMGNSEAPKEITAKEVSNLNSSITSNPYLNSAHSSNPFLNSMNNKSPPPLPSSNVVPNSTQVPPPSDLSTGGLFGNNQSKMNQSSGSLFGNN